MYAKANVNSHIMKGDPNHMKKLVVIFPGIGYHCDKPLLYYSRKLAAELGYETAVPLQYTFSGGNIRGNAAKMQEAFDILYEQAEASLSTVDWSSYDDILFLSKSVGTIISSAYTKKHSVPCHQILYTPLEQTYLFTPTDSIAFIGKKDPWSNVEKVILTSREQTVPIYTYDNANHSLETPDTMQNLKILKDVMKISKEYILTWRNK